MRRGGIVLLLLAGLTVPVDIALMASQPPPSGIYSDSIGHGRYGQCDTHDSERFNGVNEIAQVRESVCSGPAGYLAPSIASFYVFVHPMHVATSPGNVVLQYDIEYPDSGPSLRPPTAEWLSQSLLRISIPRDAGPRDPVIWIRRSAINLVKIVYSSD